MNGVICGLSNDKTEIPDYPRVSIVTTATRGIDPKNLSAGDQIYVRVVGPASAEFPEELQSDHYENATGPLESRVEAVRLSPELPSDIDGNPENYVEIRVNIPGGYNGHGFVYKEDKIKGKNSDQDENSKTSYLAAVIFLGLGTIIIFLAIFALYMFG